MMPPSTWARMVSGLTVRPQSTAQVTLSTLTWPPGPTVTSATSARKLPKLATSDTPRPHPFGSGLPHPALAAAS